MAVSGLLAQYLAVKNQLNYVHSQQTRWNNLAAAMTKKLSSQETLEQKWESSSEAASADFGSTKEFKAQGEVLQNNAGVLCNSAVGCGNDKVKFAELYASKAVPKFDSELLEEYTDLDMEYSTMQSMYDTLCTELEAQEGALKEQVGKEAQDNHLIGG